MAAANHSTLTAILDALPHPAIAISAAGRVLVANSASNDLFGDILPESLFSTRLRAPKLIDLVQAVLDGALPQDCIWMQSGSQATYIAHCKACDMAAAPQRGSLPSAVLLTLTDITDSRQSDQMRRDFVANVSHELRTPLTSLIGFIETLQGPAREDAAARDRFLDIMHSEAARMNRLIGDLLSLSTLQAQERVRPKDRIDLHSLAHSVLKGLEPVANSTDARLFPPKAKAEVWVQGDADQLRQVLSNLVENAIKYGGDGVRVAVTLSGPAPDTILNANAVTLTVSDTGPGIAAIHVPRLTERFYRVDDHRSRQMGGTGLGLAIVKHVVTRHRGRMKITSQPDSGTQVHILIPAAGN